MASPDKNAKILWRSVQGTATVFLVIPATGYYAFLLTGFTFHLFSSYRNGLVFNSMLLHLLQGRVDIDPAAITYEGYLHNGRVYSYFGIAPALFRVIFLWLPNFAAIDFTVIACLTAVCVMALFKLLSARLIWCAAGRPQDSVLLALMAVAIVASGPQIQFLRPSIYQEVELWAGALAAAFVYLVLCGLTREEGFTLHLLLRLAMVAGLCLLTRVSNAIGLYTALGLLWLVLCWHELRAGSSRSLRARLAARSLPVLILLGFAAAVGLVNYWRWGNPLVFVDFNGAQIGKVDWWSQLLHHGDFNLSRLGFGLIYYFLPIWVGRDGAGHLLLLGQRGFGQCCVELPPSSFFISDPLLIGLAAFGFVSLLRRPGAQRALALAVGGGFLVPILLMMTFFYMTFRYRMEFYPLFDLFAFLGLARLLASQGRWELAVTRVATFAGVVTAHAMWLLYCISPFGPAGPVLGPLSVGEYYRSIFWGHNSM
jgi:hypothetical protein